MKLEAKKQESTLEMQMKAEVQAQELALEREKAIANMNLEREKMAFEREKAQTGIELEAMKMQMENEHKSESMKFDQQCRMEDMTMKTQQENTVAEDKIMPQVLQTMEGLVNQLKSVVEDQKKFQSELVKTMTKPKQITLTKDASGVPTSATIQ